MTASAQNFDALILGAGAAGLMCAIEAGRRGLQVALLERADRIGKKILISGGGRCNFTNLHTRPENFLSANPHFAKSALARYTSADFIALVEKHRIPYHEKTLGQLFCDRSARDIVAMLESECRAARVSIFLDTKIEKVSVGEDKNDAGFTVHTADAEFHAPKLVIATGGLSIPKIGATSFGYDLAHQFGVKIREPWPALVPLIFNEQDRKYYSDLAGVSAEVLATAANDSDQTPSFREKMLFTHRGLSGPAILQISSYWKKPEPISIDLAPELETTSSFRDIKKTRTLDTLKSELRKLLPNRLADHWLELHPPAAWTNTALVEWERQLHAWTITPSGTEGYEKAEVTAGGIDTSELDAKTMESKKIPGLFFIGEVVDVTGHLGGFNFQWAWSSGTAAGRAL